MYAYVAVLDVSCPFFSGKEGADIFLKGLETVLSDESFKIVSSKVAIEAREVAVSLLKWCSADTNKEQFYTFANEIVTVLRKPIVAFSCKSCNREVLWRNYFLQRSSEHFVRSWVNFLKSLHLTPTPVLYQHVTDLIFRQLIQNSFLGSAGKADVLSLTKNEGRAMRYAIGYICRHLRKKIEKSHHEHKEELILCLVSLCKDSDSEDHGTDEDWIKAQDRGGLVYVKETTYSLFLSIETEVRAHLQGLTGLKPSSSADIMIKEITSSEDVLFYWLICSADFEIEDSEVHDLLLQMITKLYVSMRGHSYSNALLEKFKQSKKKLIQRSKSLRRDVYESGHGN